MKYENCKKCPEHLCKGYMQKSLHRQEPALFGIEGLYYIYPPCSNRATKNSDVGFLILQELLVSISPTYTETYIENCYKSNFSEVVAFILESEVISLDWAIKLTKDKSLL